MKTLVFTLLFSSLVISQVTAQLKLGIVGGANYSSISFDGPSLPTKNVTGYFIGVLPRIILTKKFNVSVEAQYSAKGFGLKDTSASSYRIEYVDLIPQFEYNIFRGLWIGLGFNLGIKVCEKTKENAEDTWVRVKNAHIVSNLDAGLKVFTRLFITEKINVYAALNTGITDVKAFKFTDQDGNPVDAKQLNRNVQVGVGYTFGGIH